MKKIINLAINDIKIEFSDRSTLLFFFVLPLVFTAILGASFGGNGDPDSDWRFPVPVVDLDQSGTSSDLLTEMESSTLIRIETMSAARASELFQSGDVAAALTIPEGLENQVFRGEKVSLELLQSPNDPNVLLIEQAIYTAASTVSSAVQISLNAVQAAETIQPFASGIDRETYLQASLLLAENQLADPVAVSEITQAPQAPRTYFNAFELSSAGQLVTWTLITLLGASEVFVNERTTGTLRRLFITPASRATILTGKITARLGMGLIQMVVLILVGGFVFKVNWGRSPLALGMVVLSFGLAAVSLGVMLGAFSKTRSQASGLTVMFSMVMAALGGAWWQLEITPPLYQKIVQVLPSTWAMKGFNKVIVQGGDPETVLNITLVLLGFAVIFFVVGIWKLEKTES
jgi:ABC-2 type transport system permease protein